MLVQVEQSNIYTEIDIFYVNSYIQYIIELLKILIIKHNMNINIILGTQNYRFNNSNKVIKIAINWEHNLVKKNGRDINPMCLQGKVLTNTGEPYLVRIDKYEELINSDIVIDYSIPNIYNIHICNHYNNLFNKLVYISPTIFDYNLINYKNTKREINVLTTFIHINEPRRK